MTKQRRAESLLVLTTAFWGVSYYLTRICLAEMGPLTLNAFRFLSAFAVLSLIYRKNLRALRWESAKWGVLVGLVLVIVYVAATYGVMYTSLSNAGFISCLAVLITPLIELAVFRKKPGGRLTLSLVLCTAGLALLTLGDGLRFASGDLICLLCSVAYASDIVITDRAVSRPQVDPVGMSVTEIGVTGGVFLALSLLFEQPRLPQTPAVWGAALTLGLFCSGMAFVIQTTQQRYTSPARVALIFTLEPVFSAAVAYFLADERLRPRGYFGAALMIFSLLLTQLPRREARRKDDAR